MPTVSETDMAEPAATATAVPIIVPTVPAVAAPDACSRRSAQRRGFCTEQVVTRWRTLIIGMNPCGTDVHYC